ncbi:MAG: aldehyde ferredoxin oxidoreductase N-terminal domain-containing protein [Candidatus Helarchaeota archaeon]
MEYYGYTGNIARVDLTSGKISIEKLEIEDIKLFIGGLGINTRLIAEGFRPGIDPMSPENRIIIGTGPMVGTIVPGASRTVGTTKFPATGAVVSVCGSGSFGINLKMSGYDHLIIEGASEDPVYLEVTENGIGIRDAGMLWGKDIVEATDFMRDQYGDCGVIAMGQAGEKLVKFALALIDKASTFGRGGLGAVMGSKKLKAIVARGGGSVKVADNKAFWDFYKKLFERIKGYPKLKEWQKLGLMKSAPLDMLFAATGERQKAKESSSRVYLRKLKKKRLACPSCPLGDKDVLEIKEGEYKGLINYTSSVLNDFLILMLKDVRTYNEAVKAFDWINRTGLDALSMVQFVEFFTKLYEKGRITKESTGLEWKADFETLMRLCEMVINGEGIGKVIKEGWRKVAEVYEDIEKDMLVVKGLEQVFDPRIMRMGTMEFEQVVNPKGAHVSSGGSPTYLAMGGRPLETFRTHFYRMGIPENAIDGLYKAPREEMGINVGRLTRYAEEWYTVLTSMGICARAQINRFYSLKSVTQLYKVVTGIELSEDEIRKAAERTWNLMKILNMKEGFNRKDDRFPENWFKTLEYGEIKLKLMDFYGGVEITPQIANQLIEDYYDERGWDKENGLPTKEKIRELGLEKYL